MIRRVLSQPGPAAPSVAALPPGTPVNGPLRMVYMDPAGTWVSQSAATPIVAADGAPYVGVPPASWGTLAAAGRLS